MRVREDASPGLEAKDEGRMTADETARDGQSQASILSVVRASDDTLLQALQVAVKRYSHLLGQALKHFVDLKV